MPKKGTWGCTGVGTSEGMFAKEEMLSGVFHGLGHHIHGWVEALKLSGLDVQTNQRAWLGPARHPCTRKAWTGIINIIGQPLAFTKPSVAGGGQPWLS